MKVEILRTEGTARIFLGGEAAAEILPLVKAERISGETRYPDGVPPFGPSQWLPAWPCAFRLENLRFHADWSIFDEGLTVIRDKISAPCGAETEESANA